METNTIKKAVKWWAETIARPSSRNFDNGTALPLAALLALSWKDPLPEEKIPEFEKALEEVFQKEFDWKHKVVIENDYDTDSLLCQAARRIGLDPESLPFPWKTWMTVTADTVTVRFGYNGTPQVL